MTIFNELIVCLVCGCNIVDVDVPSSLNVSTKDFTSSSVTGGVVDVELFSATGVLPCVENTDDSFDVCCVRTKWEILFLVTSVVSNFVSVGDAGGGVIF